MRQFFSQKNHDKGQLLMHFALLLIAAGLPLSRFLVSVGSIFLSLGFLILLFQKKISRPSKQIQRALLVFLGLFLVHALWLLMPGDNFQHAIRDLKIKLPLLVFAVVFSYCPVPPKRFLIFILEVFIVACCASAAVTLALFVQNLWLDLGKDYREFSPFFSHIRLSLSLVLAIGVLFLCSVFQDIKGRIYIKSLLFLVFVLALYCMQSLTGFGILLAISVLFSKQIFPNKLGKVWMGFFVLLAGYIGFFVVQYVSGLEPKPSDTKSWVTENGTYVYTPVDNKELAAAWEKRSAIPLDSSNATGYQLQGAMMRYLSSKGLPKNAAGISALLEKDVRKIEQGQTNYLQETWWPLRARLEALRFQLEGLYSNENPNSTSVGMRSVYWELGWQLFTEKPLLGWGVQNLKTAYSQKYEDYRFKIDPAFQKRAHNQWITLLMSFGIVGFAICLGAFLVPLKNLAFSHFKSVSWMFLFMTAASFFFEDTLETQMGASFVGFWYAWWVFFMPRQLD